MRLNSPFSLPSVTMASVVNLQVLYSGQSRCFGLVGFSLRISTYLLRGTAALPSFVRSVGRADLYQLRFRRDGLADVRIDLCGVAFWIGARIVLRRYALEQKNIVAGALRAIDTRAGLGHKRGVFFRERRGGKLQQNVVLNPLLQVANGKQDAL
jgi:hypothetical protein